MKERRELWPQGILCCPLGCDAASWKICSELLGSHSRVASWAAEEASVWLNYANLKSWLGYFFLKALLELQMCPWGMGEDDAYIWVPGW